MENLSEQVVLSNGQIAQIPATPGFGERVNNHPAVNTNNAYFLMKNKWGRVVPVEGAKVGEALSRGFVHTDGKLIQDDLSLAVQPPEPAPEAGRVLADLAEVLIEEKKTRKKKEETEKPDKK